TRRRLDRDHREQRLRQVSRQRLAQMLAANRLRSRNRRNPADALALVRDPDRGRRVFVKSSFGGLNAGTEVDLDLFRPRALGCELANERARAAHGPQLITYATPVPVVAQPSKEFSPLAPQTQSLGEVQLSSKRADVTVADRRSAERQPTQGMH